MYVRLVVTRLVLTLATLLTLSFVIFYTTEVLPGDIAQRVLGRTASEEAKAKFREKLRLDRPVHERYRLWLTGVVRGDFGQALTSSRPVSEIVLPGVRNTFLIGGLAFLLYIPLSLLLGSLAAAYRDRTLDTLISLFTLIGLSVPEFVMGPILLILFAVKMPIFPVVSLIDQSKPVLASLRAFVLPSITLALIMAAYAIRMLRDNLIEVLDSDYVRMATLKGLRPHHVMFRHAIPNALAPTLNVTALNLSYLIGGVVIVERVFSYPGLGSLLVEAIRLRDAPVIEAIVLICSAIYVGANLAADLVAIALNPKLRA